MTEENNQEFLKKLDKVDETGKRIVNRIMIILYAVFTVVALSLTVYYGVLAIQGNDNTKQFVSAFILLLLLGAIPPCYKLFDLVFCYFFKKDTTYDPGTAVLPVTGTVTLEDALHKMSSRVGVIVWDSLWGCVLFSMLFLLISGTGDTVRIIFSWMGLAAFTAVGHIGLHFIWKKSTLTKKMLRNMAEYWPISNTSDYAKAVEESLKRSILSYEKELIVTDEYILGNAQWDTSFHPVAIPREQIDELVFYYRRLVNGQTSRTVGILSCRAVGRNPVNLVLGLEPKVNKVLRILNYYKIPWREEKMTYM